MITKIFGSSTGETRTTCSICHEVQQRMLYCTYKRYIAARSCNHYCRVKAISIIYFDCGSVAIGIQHAKRMRYIILLAVTCLAQYHFFHTILKLHDFWKKKSY
jgi:hypothetical protein